MLLNRNPFRARFAGLLAAALLLQICFGGLTGLGQTAPEPRREQLLNGLNILLWERPGSPDVLIKLRVNSGSAFDLAGKAGTMAILGDALFADPTTREYITGELGGRLEVTTDYNAINVTLGARTQDFERLLEVLRTAIVNVSLTADRVAELREARAKLVRESGTNPTLIADRAVSARLFGDYPYGRPLEGSTATLARIERADVQYARERFLNPNNSTLVIVGGIERGRAMRALRQLLGVWRKSEGIVPSTFKQPEAPSTQTLLVDFPGTESAEVRVAARGLARSDRDYAAASVLALVARDRWQAAMPELKQTAFFVRHEAHVLPGIFLMGASVRASDATRAIQTAQQVIQDLAKTPPTATELERARGEAIATFNRQMERPDSVAELWLDAETYKLASISERARAFSAVTASDVQRVAAKLFSTPAASAASKTANSGVVSVVVGSASQLKSDLERSMKVEVIGGAEEAAPPPTPKAASPGSATRKTP
ncbi:MAG TPA: pitrilysin family protein [Pyrinomonadaceae bacterium]|nr:pitrilysin family protein [Pyrinomonadaceae bacterium]